MTSVAKTLDAYVSDLATMTDADLADLLYLLERAYIHALIEVQLRGAPS